MKNNTPKKKIILTKAHFDRAIMQSWSTETCVLAQCAKDYDMTPRGMIKLDSKGNYVYPFSDRDNKQPSNSIMRTFDQNFRNPGDETKPILQKLRASLPIVLGTI